VLEVIDLTVCLRSSVEISYLPTIGIIVNMVSRVTHTIIGIEYINFVTTEVLNWFKVYKAEAKNQFEKKIKILRYDREGSIPQLK